MSRFAILPTAAAAFLAATFGDAVVSLSAGSAGGTTLGFLTTYAPEFVGFYDDPAPASSRDGRSHGGEAAKALSWQNVRQVAPPAVLDKSHVEDAPSRLRGDYGVDLYGSEDGGYSTIGYLDGGGYHANHHAVGYGGAWEDEEEGVKWGGLSVSSVFHMSLTVLAFLAFGGFLVHLILQSMRDSKGYDSGGMTTMSPETLVLVPLKRPKAKTASFPGGEAKKAESGRVSEFGGALTATIGGRREELEKLFERISNLLEEYPYSSEG